MRVLACPASLKGVLSAVEAAAALGRGMRRVPGAEVAELPVADGGEGTLEVLALEELRPYAELPGAGAAGGLGAALAAVGAELVPGARLVLETIGFDPRGFDLVVTGEGAVDRTTKEGKAPGEVARRCAEAGVRCVVFGGRVEAPVEGTETVELSGDPARAADDLAALGETLARSL